MGSAEACLARPVAHPQGTYFFSDGLQYVTDDWEYCTNNDRRFWREHNAFIVPPIPGRRVALYMPCLNPSAWGGRICSLRGEGVNRAPQNWGGGSGKGLN